MIYSQPDDPPILGESFELHDRVYRDLMNRVHRLPPVQDGFFKYFEPSTGDMTYIVFNYPIDGIKLEFGLSPREATINPYRFTSDAELVAIIIGRGRLSPMETYGL